MTTFVAVKLKIFITTLANWMGDRVGTCCAERKLCAESNSAHKAARGNGPVIFYATILTMKEIAREKFHKRVTKQFGWEFNITEEGLYIAEISARARGEKQIGPKQTDDDDLRIEIDGRKFSQIKNQRYFDSPAAFSGGKLHNLKKTVFFLIYFSHGKHTITFVPDRKPRLEEVAIKFAGSTLSQVDLVLNEQAEEGDRRPWITFVLVDLPLEKIEAEIKTERRFFDSDDVKILIDGKIKRNTRNLFWKFWFWAGSFFSGETKTEIFETRMAAGLHYIELWADRTPSLLGIGFDFGARLDFSKFPKTKFTTADVQIYTYQGVDGKEDYNRFDAEIVDAVNRWNGEFLSQEYPPPEPLHPNLVKAMIYIESRMGYSKTGEGYYPAYPDVMQIADPRNPAIHSMLGEEGYEANEFISEKEYGHMSYNYPAGKTPNGDEPEDSIFWGTRWLYHKAQYLPQTLEKPYKREWRDWRESVQNYNDKSKRKYEEDVYDVYEKGIDERSKQRPVKLWAIVLALGISIGTFSFLSYHREFSSCNDADVAFDTSAQRQAASVAAVREAMTRKLAKYNNKDAGIYHYGVFFKDVFSLCDDDDGCYHNLIFPKYIKELVAGMKTFDQFIESAAALRIINSANYYHGDIDNDGNGEIVVVAPDFLNREYATLFVIDDGEKQGQFRLYEKRIDNFGYLNSPGSKLSPQNPLEILDLTGDATPEILLFLSGGRWGADLLVFQYLREEGINQIFSSNPDYLFPQFLFSDSNGNKIIEIKATGEMPFGGECDACEHIKVQEIFEYNRAVNKFELIAT
jgi:hypothetical protein